MLIALTVVEIDISVRGPTRVDSACTSGASCQVQVYMAQRAALAKYDYEDSIASAQKAQNLDQKEALLAALANEASSSG